MAKKPKVYQVSTINFDQLDREDQAIQVRQLQSFAASQDGDFRLMSYVTQWNPTRWRTERSYLARHAPHSWQKQTFKEEIRLGARVANESKLQSVHHYLIMYNYEAGAGELSSWNINAVEKTPSPPLPGFYAEGIDHLRPIIPPLPGSTGKQHQLDSSRPYGAIIAAYEFKDAWNWEAPLTRLLIQADGAMVLCLDCKAVSQKKIEFMVNQVQSDTQDVTRISDQETMTKFQDAHVIMDSVTRGERLHNTRLFILLIDKNLTNLRERIVRVKTFLSPFMRITDLKGKQYESLNMFSPIANPSGVPDTQHNVLSRGIGHMMGTLGYATQENYDGLFFGIKQSIHGNVTGLKYHNPWPGQKASHTVFFGKTGYGKTVAMQALMARVAASGAQVVFLEPQGHSKRLASLVGAENVAYNEISHDTVSYNPLDVVATTFNGQFSYFLFILEFLLNPLSGEDPSRPRRYLSNEEIGAVSEALQKTYQGYAWNDLLTNQSNTPLLELFVNWLERINAGRKLAQELKNLYIVGPWAESFNRTSTLSVQLNRPDGRIWPIVIYDLSRMLENSKAWLPFYYFVLLSSINRESRRPPANGRKRVRRVVGVDELRYVTGGTRLVEWLADQIATARTFRVSYWVADQNPRTLAGIADENMQAMGDAQDITSRLHMLGNMETVMTFHLEKKESAVMSSLYPELTRSHLDFLNTARAGQVLMKSGSDVNFLYMQLSAGEYKHLIGS